MSRLPVKALFVMFFLLSLLLFLSMYLTSDALLGRVNCVMNWPSNFMIDSPSKLTNLEFSEEYIGLNAKVEELGPGQRLVNSFFHYFHENKEITQRHNILIAVITTQKYLLTRVQALYETWVRDASPFVKIYFFVGDDCNTSNPRLKHLPIIKLRNIRDNVYPPQEKVFAVLKYIHYKFGEDFKWFLRADDDVYIRVRELEKMLDRLDWADQLYLGHPGYGKKEDRDRLKLLPHENYCMGGPGVVFSAKGLETLYPNLDKCLIAVKAYNEKWGQKIGWYNEDVELGRCVSRTMGINCSMPSKKLIRAFFPDYKSEALNVTTLWTKEAFREAITIHPVKQPENIFSIHHFYKTLEHSALEKQLVEKNVAIETLCKKLPANLVPLHPNRTAINCPPPVQEKG